MIIFYSMLPNGDMDDYSLHGGCDVLDKEATKWSANFWLWNKPYADPRRTCEPCPAPFPLTMGSPSYTLRYHFNDRARKRFTAEISSSWCAS